MAYTLEQVKEILTDAAIRANWNNFLFRRARYEVEVIFGNCFIENGNADGDFYKSYTCTTYGKNVCYKIWENGMTTEITEGEWFAQVEKYFWTICGTHLKVEEKTA